MVFNVLQEKRGFAVKFLELVVVLQRPFVEIKATF